MTTVKRFLALDRRARALLLEALWWLLVVRAALLVAPSKAVRLGLKGTDGSGRRDTSAREIQWAVLAASRRLPGTHCLARSLACLALLRDRPGRARMRIGVSRPEGTGLKAHAWVVHEGEALLPENGLREYTALSTGAPLP